MEFHTLLFLFRWLPVVLLLYLLYFRTHAREAFLLVVSLLFYAWGEPLYVFLLIALGAAHYLLARRMSDERWRWLLLPSVIADVFLLVYFKYYGTILDQLSSFFSLSYEVMPMPSGISFFMFSLLSYLADVGRGKIEPERSLCRFLLYVSFFPKLLMGPIMRYADFRIQLERPYAQRDQMNKGVCLFIAGLAQKVILSAWMADLFARMGQLPLSFVSGWGQAVAYSLQLYFDFAGYSLMAFGLAAMFGFYVPVNFRYPYLSDSISAFWRRWHITLGAWFPGLCVYPAGRQPPWEKADGHQPACGLAAHGAVAWHHAAVSVLGTVSWRDRAGGALQREMADEAAALGKGRDHGSAGRHRLGVLFQPGSRFGVCPAGQHV